MRKRFVKAVVLNSYGTKGKLHRGEIVTLDLHQAYAGGNLIGIKNQFLSGPWYTRRFAIDPLLNAGRN